MTNQSLFPARRVCVCNSDHSATPRKRQKGEPIILGLALVITRTGKGKTMQKSCRSVTICEECLIKAIAPSVFGATREAKAMLAALREGISASYSSLLEEDQ